MPPSSTSPRHTLSAALTALALCAAPACAGPVAPTDTPGARVALSVAPLSLAGVDDACYTVTVFDGADPATAAPVWSLPDLCSVRYGDGAGALSYVGPCDASGDGASSVRLIVQDLCAGGPCDLATGATSLPAASWQNPCPAPLGCTRPATCEENADAAVTFELAIVRAANQGFFDVAVEFDDIFCSAKLDCVDEDGTTPIALLHNPDTGERDTTAVVGFACAGGGSASTTHLYMSDVDITCDGGTVHVDPSAGPGTLPASAITGTLSDILFGAASYRGAEQLGFDKRYWNLALGLDEGVAGAAATGSLVSSLTLVDTTEDGQVANHSSSGASLGGGGPWVAFNSGATNFATPDEQPWHEVVAKNVVTGATHVFRFDGVEGLASCDEPDVTPDGENAVARCFGGVVPGDNGVSGIYLFDRDAGTATRVSVTPDGDPANDQSFSARISEDGAYVYFRSQATDLVRSLSPTGIHLYRYEVDTETTKLVDYNHAELPDGEAYAYDISADGERVVFGSNASNLIEVGQLPGGNLQIFLRDMTLTGAASLTLVSANGAGQVSDSNATGVAMSSTGDVVAFISFATDLVAGDDQERPGVFVWDEGDDQPTLERVVAVPADATYRAIEPHLAVSPGGRFVAFAADHDFVEGTPLGSTAPYTRDAFVHDRQTGLLHVASLPAIAPPSVGMPLSTRGVTDVGEVLMETSRQLLPGLDGNVHIYLSAPIVQGGAGACTLSLRATASDGALAEGRTPAGTTYPFVAILGALTDTDGALACGRHGLNDGDGVVSTTYTAIDGRRGFAHCYGPTACDGCVGVCD